MKKYIFVLFILVIAIGLIGCSKEGQEKTPITQNEQPENKAADADNLEVKEEEIEGTAVTEEGTLKEFQEIANKLYFNFLYKPTADMGSLTERDMQLFAISYIYQYEYDELRFDSDKFVLYIPEQNVSDTIKLFFDYDFTNHKYPDNSTVTYENGYYLMKARDENLGEAPSIDEAFKLTQTKYKLVFSGTKDGTRLTYELLLEDKDNRWIIVEYKEITPEEEQAEEQVEEKVEEQK